MLKKIFSLSLVLLLWACAPLPGPSFIGNGVQSRLGEREVLEWLDETYEKTPAKKMDRFAHCKAPNLVDLYDRGVLKIHRLSWFETADICTDLALPNSNEITKILFKIAAMPLGCANFDVEEDGCTMKYANIYHVPDVNNHILIHEGRHIQFYADKLYGSFGGEE
jgi:hypothetical protein